LTGKKDTDYYDCEVSHKMPHYDQVFMKAGNRIPPSPATDDENINKS
jgi:hypothetical protein